MRLCILVVTFAAAMAAEAASSVFTDLGGYATYEEWKVAQVASSTSSATATADAFEAGGFQTGVSATAISLEARFRTWLESAARSLDSTKLKGLMMIFR